MIRPLIYTLIISLAIIGCEGAEGPVGPEGGEGPVGPIGPQGPEGPRGPSGQDGEDGADGIHCWDLNENGVNDPSEDVNGDDQFTAEDCQSEGGVGVTTTMWSLAASEFSGDDVDQIYKTAPSITRAVLDGGIVLGYYTANRERWLIMPVVISPYSLTYAYQEGVFVVQAIGGSGAELWGGTEVKAVVIPPSQVAGKGALDYTDYEAVARYYGLE